MNETRQKQTDELQQLLKPFIHREVRDLAWVIVSPPLVSGNFNDTHWWSYEDCVNEFNDCLPALMSLDQHPESLFKHLSALRNQRLGSIFEGYISYWLHISPNYDEIKQNIQIIEDNHTYGEIDFLIKNLHTNETIHLEVAVKFYLGSAPFEDAYRWFGTNTRDQLGKKISHLQNHQTQLSKNYPKKLEKYYPDTIHQRACFVKGRLFYPENSNISPQNIGLDDKHLRGTWTYTDQRDPTHDVIQIQKPYWLAELSAHDTKALSITSQSAIDTIDRAECFVEIRKDKEPNEKQRCFYLPTTFTFPESSK